MERLDISEKRGGMAGNSLWLRQAVGQNFLNDTMGQGEDAMVAELQTRASTAWNLWVTVCQAKASMYRLAAVCCGGAWANLAARMRHSVDRRPKTEEFITSSAT
ncbi:hypothetical protein RRG08_012665 [Elysia crispata]|uniref:Uncharacterized protein n=1 Tax=Elysia crispata TaxID=231223 RepID=A0AAE1D1K3_9GAST|nr:hypothetical protein RRG08_012665 [Elysia crispata]